MASEWPASFGSFFKVILDPSTEMLLLPPVVSTSITEMLPLRAFLHTPNGQIWAVDIEYLDEGVSFTNGWTEFVTYNNIRENFFVTFTPAAFHTFDVAICTRRMVELTDYGMNPINNFQGASFRLELTPAQLIHPRLSIPMRFWNMFIKRTTSLAIVVYGEKQWEVAVNHNISNILISDGCEAFIEYCRLSERCVIEFKIINHQPLTFELIVLN